MTTVSEIASASLEIRLFGPFEALVGGKPILPLRSQASQALVALLALRQGSPVKRAWLAATLWPDSEETQALYNLRRNLTDLRHALGPAATRLESPTPRTLRLALSAAECDLVAFDEAIARGDAPSLQRAVALYRGPLLEDHFEAWVIKERELRQQALLKALETLGTQALERHDPASAIDYLRRAVVIAPTRQRAQRALLTALAENGDFAAATQAYRDLRLLLRRELNIEPDGETIALYRQLRAQARARVQAITPAVPVRSAPPPRHLPMQHTSLIGRAAEIEEVIGCLDTARLVTLTGAGGVGKTRLAIAVADEVAEEFPDGVFFVDAAPLTDPTLLWHTLATALNVREANERSLRKTLQVALQARTLLILLDNCEHLLKECAQLTTALLEDNPGLRILATSRQPLRSAGERVWRVLSLAVPPESVNTNSLLHYDAVRLFVERASWAISTFRLTPDNAGAVVQICRRLDGIPLSIELAATRIRSLSIEEINDRLDHCFQLLTQGSRTALPRQQTLRATIDWSYDLLHVQEQTLLQRLAVFAGGWTVEAAEAICTEKSEDRRQKSEDEERTPGAGIAIQNDLLTSDFCLLSSSEVLDLLTSLVDKSLCLTEGENGITRYRLLETVRQYAMEKLSADREAVQERHLIYYLELAARSQLRGQDSRRWLDALERDHDNLRAALDWCDAPDPERITRGLRLSVFQEVFFCAQAILSRSWVACSAILRSP